MGQAKTHLSRLVKEMNKTGEPLELCVREDTVAYIVPAIKRSHEDIDRQALQKKLKASGLIMTQWPKTPPKPCPVKLPEKPLREGNAVLEMRAEKNY